MGGAFFCIFVVVRVQRVVQLARARFFTSVQRGTITTPRGVGQGPRSERGWGGGGPTCFVIEITTSIDWRGGHCCASGQ